MAYSIPRTTPSVLALAIAVGLAGQAHAEAPRAAELDAVVVTAKGNRALRNIAGASNVITLDRAGTRLANSADVLAGQPGIVVQSPGNEGSKVSIRGSGINRGPGAHASGIAVSIDGLPLTGAGGTPYELLEPSWLSRVEVLRGANGLQRGAAALGGSIDYTSRSGRDSAGVQLDYQAGSHGYQKRGIRAGGVNSNLDWLLAYTDTEADGYQRHAASEGRGAMANLGWQISPELETRFFLRWRQTDHQTPGRLTREQIRNNPRAANAYNLSIDANRPQHGSTWLGNMTRWQIDADSSLQAGLVYHRYPMDLNESLYRQQLDYAGLNASVLYQRQHTLFGYPSQTRLGLRASHDLDADVRESLRRDNNGYAAGTQTRRFSHYGTDTTVHVDNTLSLHPQLDLHSSLAAINTRREVQVRWPQSDGRVNQQQWDLAPRVGLSWQQSAQLQWFGNLSRSLEAAHPWSMIWGSDQYFGPGNGPSSGRQSAPVPMRNQTANTLELGARGQAAIGQWELTGYYAHLKHELLSVELRPAPDLFVAENNASPTVHRGIEAGLDSPLWQGADGRLSLRQAYTFSDFRYRHDARFGRNQLPGLPRHAYQAQLRFDHASGLYAAINTDYASRMAVDYANSFWADSRVLLGSRIGYDAPGGRWQAWAEMRNIGDRRYAASVTPGYNDAGRDLARSTPGEGRSVYAGVSWRLD